MQQVIDDKKSKSIHMIVLNRGGMHIGIRVPSRDDVVWLAENLCPGFDLVETDQPDWLIEVFIDPDGHSQQLMCSKESLPRPSTCFGFDGHPGEVLGWDSDPNIFHDLELNLFYSSNVELQRIAIIANAPRDSIRIAILRVVREIATDHLLRLGWIPFHAAAFASKGRGVLVVGPKRAGKTSLLLHALSAPSSHPISNDRAFIGPSPDGQLRLEGLPTVVGIREGTAELLGRQDWARARDWRARHTLAQVKSFEPVVHAMVPAFALSLSPHQFHTLVDRSPIAGGSLSVILFPKIDASIQGISFRQMPQSEVAERLTSNLLPLGLSPLLHHSAGVGESHCVEAIANHGLCRLPALECILGQNAFDVNDFAAAVFDQIQA